MKNVLQPPHASVSNTDLTQGYLWSYKVEDEEKQEKCKVQLLEKDVLLFKNVLHMCHIR